MKTGICTTDFEKSAEKKTADELFGIIHELGFRCVQFAFSSVAECGYTPNGQLEIPSVIKPECCRAVFIAAEKYDLPIEVINGTYNMAHPDPDVRAEGLKRLETLMQAAKELSTEIISLCSGTRNAKYLWSPSDENENEDAWADMYDSMQRATELAEQYGITLAIESEASNVIRTPEKARRLLDSIGSDKLKMILDCANLFHMGHAHKNEAPETICHAVEVYGKDIVVVHGKDIREGDGIEFCATGLGIVDFALTAELLRQIGYKGDMFLHGIYDISDMKRSREFWETASGHQHKTIPSQERKGFNEM